MEVLIVDDNPVNLLLFERLCRRLPGCAPRTVDAPLAALQHCRSQTPDLIVVDYMMPSMDGIEFIEHVRALPNCADLPIVMVTADLSRAVRQRALEVGATDFLTKPVDSQEFTVRARNMLALRAAQKRLEQRANLLADEVARATERIRANEHETLLALARAAEFRDPETGAHVLRMAHYARLVARELGLPAHEQELLLHATPLHDLGKLGTPDNILLKPGRLTSSEFLIMQQHARIGWEILHQHQSPILQAGAQIALSHHERFDGTGYPERRAGSGISLYGRITAVADVFDALTSPRPYKQAWTPADARAWLVSQSGRHFDPELVTRFLARFDEVLDIRATYADEPECVS